MTISSAGEIYAVFEDMRIKHDKLLEFQQFYDDLRVMKRHSPLSPQGFGTLFAPSQAGKSTTIKHYIETIVVDEVLEKGLFPESMDRDLIALRQNIVLHVTLSPKANIKSLASDILMALGDPFWEKGTQQSLMKRVYDYLRSCHTELLFIDEIQHLSHKTTRDAKGRAERSPLYESTEVADALKTMLIRGVVPMMFIGIPEAKHLILNEKQISGRCLRELKFEPLDASDEKSRKIFRDYTGMLGLKLQKDGLFEEASNFLTDDITACLHEVSGGLLGMVSNIVCQASVLAIEERARSVTREHLAMATEVWAIPTQVVDYNPFRRGIRRKKPRTLH
jgi:hypothetical protein